MIHHSKNFRELKITFKILDHRLSLIEAAIKVFFENDSRFSDRQIILLNIIS